MSKVKPLQDCKTPKDIEKFCDANGLPVLRTSGGHAIRGNKNGSFPISAHSKEIPKGTLHAIKKQISLLIVVAVVLLFVVRPLFF